MINKKGRGRPKKSKSYYAEPIEKHNNEIENKKEDIIVFFALSEEDSKNENDYEENVCENTVIEDEDENNTNIFNNNASMEDYLTLDDNEDETKNISFYDKSEFLEELKKKDKIIENLKNKALQNQIFKKTNIIYNCVQLVKDTKKFVPSQTDIKCWWCDEKFNNLPAYIVSNYKDGEYHIFGNFCSFNCSAKYNITMLKDYKWNTRHSLINNLKTKITGDTTPISLAPERELLISKGGNMSIEEFRDGFQTITNLPKLSMPPLIPLIHSIQYNKF